MERIGSCAFGICPSLERIAIPLKDNLITADNLFQACKNLNHVDLIEVEELHETIAALHMEEWRNDMHKQIDAINRILPTAPAGDATVDEDAGEKSQAIRRWIRSVLRKIDHYQEEHQRLMDEEVAPTIQLALPRDIVMNNVLTFLVLPSYTFE